LGEREKGRESDKASDFFVPCYGFRVRVFGSEVGEARLSGDLVNENFPKSKCELIQPNNVKFTSNRYIWDLFRSWLRFFCVGYVLGTLGKFGLN